MASHVMGTFRYEEDFLSAARGLKSAGFDGLTLMSPIPVHEAEKIQGLGKSNVRRFSLAGAIIGALGGFGLATFSALSFIMPSGGRAVIAFPPFLVITYEMTILLGVLFTLLGFHVVSDLPAWFDAPYTEETNVDRFSVVVKLDGGVDGGEARQIMNDSGAEEVRDLEGYR